MTITLRDYQVAAVDSIFDYFGRAKGNPLVVCPTGAGKSLILSSFIQRALAEHPTTRILVATHRKELIVQDAEAIRRLGTDCGIWSAGLGMRQLRPVTVAGVQSIAKKRLGHFDLMIVDEAHLVPQADAGMYRDVIASLKSDNDALKIIGLTATPYRLNGGLLTRGDDKIFSSICYDIKVQKLVDDGYLSPLVSPQVELGVIDTSQAKVRGGDFITAELSGLADNDPLIDEALNEFERLASDRKSALFFCITVEHASSVVRILRMRGVSCELVTGDTEDVDRKARIARYKAGEVRALVSVDVLTTGFDAPRTDCIVMLRPTMSCGLYVQIAGRGMRLFPGKKDCLVLDFGGNIERHGPITDVRPKSTGQALAKGTKECPECMAEVASWKKECGECGYVFPGIPKEIDHDKQASRAAIMAPPKPPEPARVASTMYGRHEKADKPPSMRVTYMGGFRPIASEWVCFEHDGFAQRKACQWWHEHGGQKPYPGTVDEALERTGELREVDGVMVEEDGKFTRVTKCILKPMREPGADDDLVVEMTQEVGDGWGDYQPPPTDELEDAPF